MELAPREVQITLVGGGSHNWAPKLLADLAYTKSLSGRLVLMDINPRALDLMTRLGQKMMHDLGGNFQVEGTTDLDAALVGADYVILTINTGSYEASRQDIEIPERYGVVQTVGDTVGPGGLIRGIRNIPVVVHLAQRMEVLCPRAWLINYSNPMGILTHAVSVATDIQVVGLCHELQGLERTLMYVLGLGERGRIKFKVGGINHFSWVLDAWLDGESIFPRLHEHAKTVRPADIAYEDFSPYGDQTVVKFGLLQTTGVLGVAGDRHIVEFYSCFLTPESQWGWKYGVKRTTPDDFEEAYRENGAWARAMLEGKADLPSRSEEIVFDLIASIEHDWSREFFVNLPNVGQIANLPLDRVVETYAVANAKGLTPVALGELPPSVAPQVRLHSDIQEMIVEATLTGDKALARQAFLLDPLIRDFNAGRAMFEEMCEVQNLFRRGDAAHPSDQ